MHPENHAIVGFAFVFLACHHSGSGSGADADSDLRPTPVPMQENLKLAAGGGMFGAGDLRIVGASEEANGRDLDGDGDTTDFVLQILDLGTNQLIDTGLATPRDLPLARHPVAACSDALGVFKVSEAETGRDLDRDGIRDEVTTWVFNRRTGKLRNLSFEGVQLVLDGELAAFIVDERAGVPALVVFDGRDGSLTRRPVEPSIMAGARAGVVAFMRGEHGAFDLNADGDATDSGVLHLYDAASRNVLNTSLDVAGVNPRLVEGFAGFNVSEADHGGLDLNGDGDAQDLVFLVVDVKTGQPRFPGFNGASFSDPSDRERQGFLLALSEQDGDRNGDGDTLDLVAAHYDPSSDRLVDTRLAIEPGIQKVHRAGRWISVMVSERSQGRQDLDGDGRLESQVAHVFDTRTGQSVNLGFRGLSIAAIEDLLVMRVLGTVPAPFVAWDSRAGVLRRFGTDVADVHGASGVTALVSVRESAQDLNGDGDVRDFVFAFFDMETGSVRSLGLASNILEATIAPSGQTLVLVSEAPQGADLNGDGDLRDEVVHRIGFGRPRR